jgi:hypothetical protein
MYRFFVLGLVACCLAGCAGSPIASQRDARLNYEKSVGDYRACLIDNPSNLKTCENLRLVMETNERAYGNISAAVQGRSASINIQQR